MHRRLEIDAMLHAITDTANIYYQPPESVKMKYPAIRYERTDIKFQHADNLPYKADVAYKVIVMDKNPDSEIVEKISKIPTCRFITHYTKDNLNHDVFIIY